MNPIVKNVLAIILGFVAGSLVNMGIIMLGPSIIPLPEGVDPMDIENLKENIKLFEPKHFISPFLAHALGTLVGAFVAAKIGAAKKMQLAMTIGFVFLAGGIVNVVSLGAPMWFNILDIVLAYIPVAWFGGRLATMKA